MTAQGDEGREGSLFTGHHYLLGHGRLILDVEQFLGAIARYESRLSGILSRFRGTDHRGNISIDPTDLGTYSQLILEISDLFIDAIGTNSYSSNIILHFNAGTQNYVGSPSYRSVETILSIIRAAHTRFTRNPALFSKKQAEEHLRVKENVFIIHGRDEAKWRELKDIIGNNFRLKPLILNEQPDFGKTVIEKFEHYAETCSYAVALFTPDDEVRSGADTYLQARPNVIYELGWFCGRLQRSSVMLLLKEGTSMFSDFGGIVQKRFKVQISELVVDIGKELAASGMIDRT